MAARPVPEAGAPLVAVAVVRLEPAEHRCPLLRARCLSRKLRAPPDFRAKEPVVTQSAVGLSAAVAEAALVPALAPESDSGPPFPLGSAGRPG